MYPHMFHYELDPLTRQEQQMVQDNLNLVWLVYHRMKEALFNYEYTAEDIFSVGVFGLIKAIKTYDESKGSISHWAITVIQQHFYSLKRYLVQNRHYYGAVRLGIRDMTGGSDDSEEAVRSIAVENDPDADPEVWYINQISPDVLSRLIEEANLTPKEQVSWQLSVDGYTQKEIGDMLGLSQAQISRLKSRALEKINSKLNEHWFS